MTITKIKNRLKKDDTVMVIAGKDKGKTGTITKIITAKNRALVGGINIIKKHQKPRRQDEPGGIIEKEASVNFSNLMFYCKTCNSGVKLYIDFLEDGTKVRKCKRCQNEAQGE